MRDLLGRGNESSITVRCSECNGEGANSKTGQTAMAKVRRNVNHLEAREKHDGAAAFSRSIL